MLYVSCGKLIVSRLDESWQDNLSLLLSTYDRRGATDESTETEVWSVQHALRTHMEQHPQQAGALWRRIPPELAALITRCLRVDPVERPTIQELIESPEYRALLSARISATTTESSSTHTRNSSQMNDDERVMLRTHIDDLTLRLASREERMVCLETLLAAEREAHFQTAALLEEQTEKLSEALEKLAELGGHSDHEEVSVASVLGQHHPGEAMCKRGAKIPAFVHLIFLFLVMCTLSVC